MTTPNPAPVTTSDAERAAFEAWLPAYWNRESYTADDEEGCKLYCEDWVQGAWAMWNHLRSAALRIDFKQATEQGGWQPIATAPKGEKVILFSERCKDISIDDWRYYERYNQPMFTHWQPLPAAPQSEEGSLFLGVADGDAVGGKSGGA